MNILEYLSNEYKIDNPGNLTGEELINLIKLSKEKAFEISVKLDDEYDSFMLEVKSNLLNELKNTITAEDVYWYCGDEEDERYIEFGLQQTHEDECDSLLICGNLESQYLLRNLIDLLAYLYKITKVYNSEASLSLANNLSFYIDSEGIEAVDANYILKLKKKEALIYKIYMLGVFLGENRLIDLINLGLNVIVE